jgi:hypothetical protein
MTNLQNSTLAKALNPFAEKTSVIFEFKNNPLRSSTTVTGARV